MSTTESFLSSSLARPKQYSSVFLTLSHRERGVSYRSTAAARSSSTTTAADNAIASSSDSRFLHPHYINHQLQSSLHGSHHYIEKMTLWKKLTPKHQGCVNSVLFSNNGEYILTGSDDCHVHLYHTYSGKLLDNITTAHTNNIFYAKELPSHTNIGGEHPLDWILTCAADGRVYLHHRPTSMNQLIYRHVGRAHRIAIPHASSYSTTCQRGGDSSYYQDVPGHFYTCGEDGLCCLFDLRDHQRTSFLSSSSSSSSSANHHNASMSLEESTIRRRSMLTPEIKIELKNRRDDTISIYSIGVNPQNGYEIALSGEFGAVSLFDVRRSDKAFAYLCPDHCLSSVDRSHITGLKYTADGKMLIASYNDENIYSFVIRDHQRADLKPLSSSSVAASTVARRSRSNSNATLSDEEEDAEENEDEEHSKSTSAGEVERVAHESTQTSSPSDQNSNLGYYQKYIGHRNADTVKQVSMFGSRSEFVVSGSDCGHIFLWDIHSGRLLKVLKGDRIGAVNCLAAHPVLPLLATSGLEDDAKLWMPIGDHNPLREGSEEWEKVTNLVRRNGGAGASAFRQRVISAAALRRMLFMLTGGANAFGDDDEEEENDEADEHDNLRSSESSHGSGVRRAREEPSGGSGDEGEDGGSRPARRRRRTSALSNEEDDDDEEADFSELAAILPYLRAALGRNLMTSEDDEDSGAGGDEEEEDDDGGIDLEDLPEHYRGMYEEDENEEDDEDYAEEEVELDDESESGNEEAASTEWETCESEDSQQDNQDDPFATDEDENGK